MGVSHADILACSVYYVKAPAQGAMAQLFGDKLRALRRRSAITQVDLAERLHLVSQGYIADLEAGDEVPSLDLVFRVAHEFDVSTDYLLRDTIPVESDPVGFRDSSSTIEGLSSRFGDKIRALRLERGLSQRELARTLGLASRAHISNLEAGRKAPSLDLIVRLADFFEVTTDYLLRGALLVERQGASAEARAEGE